VEEEADSLNAQKIGAKLRPKKEGSLGEVYAQSKVFSVNERQQPSNLNHIVEGRIRSDPLEEPS
jgi:hypothetical protein